MEEDATKITEKVEAQFKKEDDLHTRMDEDFKLWNMEKTSFTTDTDFATDTIKGSQASDVNIISNDARTSCDRVQSTLSDAEMQIAVRMAEAEGEDKREDIGKLERLFYFALDRGDERLRRLLLPPLRESLIWYSLVRGWVAGRFLVYKSGNNVIFDFLSLDRRWLSYEVGADGFLWVGYKTFRSKVALADEYKIGEDKIPFVASKENDNCVIDYWKNENGKISNAVVCDNKFLKNPEFLDLPSMPILIMPVATRPLIASTSSAKTEATGYGESIFAPIRGINEVRNKFASIVATWANLRAKDPTINYYDEMGVQLKTTVFQAEAVLNLPMGHNKLEEAPTKEISPTVIEIMRWLSDQMERGMLPNIPLTTPPPSGTLYNLVQEAGNKIFNPQLKNLSYFYAGACHLIEEQVIAGGIKVKVQQEQKRKYYETQVTPVDLKKPHIIKVEFTARTPWTQLDTYQIADMAKRLGLPDAFIQEYILKLPDPKGLGDQSAIEMAEHSPKLAMVRAIEALMRQGRTDEAEQLMRDLYALELSEQMQTGAGAETPRGEAMSPEMGMGGAL